MQNEQGIIRIHTCSTNQRIRFFGGYRGAHITWPGEKVLLLLAPIDVPLYGTPKNGVKAADLGI
jgi:hypothetical protein